MKALIIDDERLARKELWSLLEDCKDIKVVGEAVNVDDALEKIQKLKPDLLFLDIQMPGKTGFELLELLDSVPEVVFTTAYDEYALQAFDVNALDYLLKPIQKDRLQETIKKLLKNASNPKEEATSEQRKLGINDRVFCEGWGALLVCEVGRGAFV